MAHKGRIYKVWFRRDAAWTENFGPLVYPEAFYLPFHSLIFSARYAVSAIAQVMAINTSKDFVRIWRSPTYGGFFDNVYWTFEVLGEPNEIPVRAKFGIYHDAVIDTPLYVATYHFPLGNTEWGLWDLRNVETLHFLSPDITVSPYPLQLTIQGARYDRYNP